MTATAPGDVARWLGRTRIDLEECGSTNDEAGRLARAGAQHGTVVIARAQTSGRGREGRRWESPVGVGLYLSAVVRSLLPLADVPPMTLAIGIGVCDAARAFGARAELKWPNDVLVGGKKLAGVLVESHSAGGRLDAAIVGIGVNLAGELPASVASTAITLAAAGAVVDNTASPFGGADGPGRARAVEREPFIAALLAHVEHWLDRYAAGGLADVISEWEARMAHGLAARATVNGEAITGVLVGLDRDGAVFVRDEHGTQHRVRSGDVELVRTPPAL